MIRNENLFIKSYQMHQELINTILSFKDEDDVCRVTQKEIAGILNRHQTWVSAAIRRINTEDECVTKVKKGQYIVRYSNLMEKGTF